MLVSQLEHEHPSLNHKTNMAIYGTSRDKTKINKQLT